MDVARNLDLSMPLSRKSCFLFGPRQCGKTWLLKRALPGARVFDLLSAETFARLTSRPEYLGEACTDGSPVVIDEIQKAPGLLDEVHRLIEERGLRFLLTGSSARKLRRGGMNLLGGRARELHLHPFSASELGREFSLDRALNVGLLPGLWFSDEPEEDLRDYVGVYLREEIAAEGATRNLPAFGRFLEVAALCDGQQLNFAKISRDAQVARSTVQEYFGILEDTLLASQLPPWRASRKRKAVATPKFYLFDHGVARILQGRGRLAPGTPEYGNAFENWVHHELRCRLDAVRSREPLAFWRTEEGLEVDFLVGERTAIEAKARRAVGRDDLRGLRELRKEGAFKRFVVASLEPRPRIVDGIEILPWRTFVERLWSGDFE